MVNAYAERLHEIYVINCRSTGLSVVAEFRSRSSSVLFYPCFRSAVYFLAVTDIAGRIYQVVSPNHLCIPWCSLLLSKLQLAYMTLGNIILKICEIWTRHDILLLIYVVYAQTPMLMYPRDELGLEFYF